MSSWQTLRLLARNQLRRNATRLSLGGFAFGSLVSHNKDKSKCRLDYWEHDPKDFDVYIRNPTADDLPVLLEKFEEDGLEVWPWVWCHPNDNGPHFVFIGLNEFYIQEIKRIRAESPNNNILVIANEATIKEATAKCPNVLNDCHCGTVVDSSLALINVRARILMLKDERVISYDYLTIVEP